MSSATTAWIWLVCITGVTVVAATGDAVNYGDDGLMLASNVLLPLEQLETTDVDDDTWISTTNSQLLLINQLTAYFAWHLTVQPTVDLERQSAGFNALKTQWLNGRCTEAGQRSPGHDYDPSTNRTQQLVRIAALLCRGPRFSRAQTERLTHALTAMQTAFVDDAVCLPRSVDVCRVPFHRLWEQTFVRRARYGRMWQIQRGREPVELLPTGDGVAAFRCFSGEPDMDRLMAGEQTLLFDGSQPTCALDVFDVARWAWESWRLAVGPAVWSPLRVAIGVMNEGARRNGYTDIGAVWRAELETPELPAVMSALWQQVRPLYVRLHAVLRNALAQKLLGTPHQFDRTGPMPAHLLASMWSQNWTPYLALLAPSGESTAFGDRVREKRWTGQQVVEHADDFYASLGLPRMTTAFWQRSVFNTTNGTASASCHGTAANMFVEDDVRMIFCVPSTGATLDDVYVAVHEMGHLQYFLGFAHDQPPIFQDGHSALQEAVGDAIHLGFMAPQHLHRLAVLTDTELMAPRSRRMRVDEPFLRAVHGQPSDCSRRRAVTNDDDDDDDNDRNRAAGPAANAIDVTLLLRSALSKVAQLPFEYVLDVYRWQLFADRIRPDELNAQLWRLIERHQGVMPPDGGLRAEAGLFDAGAKYHVADNTPFARYFLASFLHVQIFRGLCEVTMFGRLRPSGRPLPMPLHRCDIYGSKRAGKLLKRAFAMGTSHPWAEVLFVLTGYREVRADAFREYYAPLEEWLDKLVAEFAMPVGW